MEWEKIMKIMLPEKFFYRTKSGIAYVKEGQLHIEGTVFFKRLIYNITYSLKGKDKCYYCGEDLNTKNRTIDHVFPTSFGGVSIPENMVPCCKTCNVNKFCMTESQFIRWNQKQSIEEREWFFQTCILENSEVLKNGYLIPKEWIEMYDVSKYFDEMPLKRVNKQKYKKLEDYFNKWHQYPKPMIVSSNGWVFEGKYIITHAKRNNKNEVSAVVLENVFVKRNSH